MLQVYCKKMKWQGELIELIKTCGGTHVRKRTSFREHAFKVFNKVPGFHQIYQSFECTDVWNMFGT